MVNCSFLFRGLLALAAVVSAAPQTKNDADYIIVGGGPSGFVVAEYLSRDPHVKVMLLEAGPDSSADPIVSSMAPSS